MRGASEASSAQTRPSRSCADQRQGPFGGRRLARRCRLHGEFSLLDWSSAASFQTNPLRCPKQSAKLVPRFTTSVPDPRLTQIRASSFCYYRGRCVSRSDESGDNLRVVDEDCRMSVRVPIFQARRRIDSFCRFVTDSEVNHCHPNDRYSAKGRGSHALWQFGHQGQSDDVGGMESELGNSLPNTHDKA